MNYDVALVNMPFASREYPSLALGLFKAQLEANGVHSKVHNLNVLFSQYVDRQIYDKLAGGFPVTFDLAGEWIFSSTLWDDNSESDHKYINSVLRGISPHHNTKNRKSVDESFVNSILEIKNRADSFLSDCLSSIDWKQYRVIGFTSVFQQHIASLAFAKRLKKAYPHLYIIFGGANCEGTMGKATLNAFDFVDAVCIGEGDLAFPELIKQKLSGGGEIAIPGILQREIVKFGSTQLELKSPSTQVSMDDLPFPNFDEFFYDSNHDEAHGSRRILFETSRGCWWGEKSHCVFCGLNGATIKFRQKNPKRALNELNYLLKRYGKQTRRVSAVDNIIPHNYFNTFLPMLKSLKIELDLFYETKANLRKDQVELYRSVGLKEIQPGIESLSTPILKLMRKGVSGIQNIQMLKFCRQFGVYAHWNYLVGFPGEKPEDYQNQETLCRQLSTSLRP